MRGSKGKDTLKRDEFLFIRGMPRNADLHNSHNKWCATIICAWKPEIFIVGFFRCNNARLCDENNVWKPFWYRIFAWLCSPCQYYPLKWKRFLLKGLGSIHHILCVSFFSLLSRVCFLLKSRRASPKHQNFLRNFLVQKSRRMAPLIQTQKSWGKSQD